MTMYETPDDISNEDQAVIDSLTSIGMLKKHDDSRGQWFNASNVPTCHVGENEDGWPIVEEKEMEENTMYGHYYMVYC